MNAINSKSFKSGNSVAVRLPKEMGIDAGVELRIERDGERVIISRVRPSIKEMIRRLRELPAPSDIEVRDPDIFPDRAGL